LGSVIGGLGQAEMFGNGWRAALRMGFSRNSAALTRCFIAQSLSIGSDCSKLLELHPVSFEGLITLLILLWCPIGRSTQLTTSQKWMA